MPEGARKTLSLNKNAETPVEENKTEQVVVPPGLHTQDAAAQPVVLPSKGTILAFDFGLARIGVATGEIESRIAMPLGAIVQEANAARFEAISALIDEWKPVYLLVGLPLSLEGEPTAMTARCRRFTNQLHGRFGLPVTIMDERLSSVQADAQLKSAGVENWRARKDLVDAGAAQIILQNFLDTHCHEPPPEPIQPKKRAPRRKKTDPDAV